MMFGQAEEHAQLWMRTQTVKFTAALCSPWWWPPGVECFRHFRRMDEIQRNADSGEIARSLPRLYPSSPISPMTSSASSFVASWCSTS